MPASAQEASTAISPGCRISGCVHGNGSSSPATTRCARSGACRSRAIRSGFWRLKRRPGSSPSSRRMSAGWPRSRSITGIRRGALFGLRWRDLNWPLGQITVPDTLSKSRKSYTVPVNRRVREVLAELRYHGNFTGPDDLIFCKRNGTPRKSVSTAWAGACKRAGIEGLRFHDLRHTAASRIVMGGGSLLEAGEHLGHSTPSMTQRYAHLSADHRARVADLTLTDSVTSLSRERKRRSRLSAK